MSDWVLSSSLPQAKKINPQAESDWVLSPSKEESFGDKLPRNIAIGLANAGHSSLNFPHNLAKSFEGKGNILGAMTLGGYPVENYLGGKLNDFGHYLTNTANEFNQQHDIPESMKNPNWNKSLADRIPHQQDYNFAEMLGQNGEPTFADTAIQKGVEYAPELAFGVNALRHVIPHLTKFGATKTLKKAKKLANEKGLNNSGEETETFFHGTPEESANKILTKGLTAPKYSQGNALLTNKPEAAEAYGARINGGDEPGHLLRISIPKKEIDTYLHPENTHWATQSLKPRGHEDAKIFGIKQPIPSKYISKVEYNEPYQIQNNPMKFNINPEIIEDARQYLPNNLDERNLLGSSQAGDYNSLFKLQSDVGKISAKRMGKIRSLFAPESNLKGEAGLAARKRLLNAIHEELQSKGHHDVSDLLRQGQNEYRRYIKFKPYRNAILGAGITAATKAALPKNALTNLIHKLVMRGH